MVTESYILEYLNKVEFFKEMDCTQSDHALTETRDVVLVAVRSAGWRHMAARSKDLSCDSLHGCGYM